MNVVTNDSPKTRTAKNGCTVSFFNGTRIFIQQSYLVVCRIARAASTIAVSAGRTSSQRRVL